MSRNTAIGADSHTGQGTARDNFATTARVKGTTPACAEGHPNELATKVTNGTLRTISWKHHNGRVPEAGNDKGRRLAKVDQGKTKRCMITIPRAREVERVRNTASCVRKCMISVSAAR
jgi:hypothetical protein